MEFFFCKEKTCTEFPANRPKLCRKCAFKQNAHTRKLHKIMVFNAVTHPFSIEYAKPFSQNYFPASMERVMHILPGRVT